jgi:hypothetical protein
MRKCPLNPPLGDCRTIQSLPVGDLGGCSDRCDLLTTHFRSLKRFATLLIVLLASLGIWSLSLWTVQIPSALASPHPLATSLPRLTLADLPSGFVPASEAEAQSCQMTGERVAFVQRSPDSAELVCASAFSLVATTENALQVEMVRKVFDSILQNPQALVEQADPDHTKALEILDLAGIGDRSTGFSTVEAGIGRTEVLLFRRGDIINSVLIRYDPDRKPIAPLKAVAQRLDQQAISAFKDATS